MTLYSVIGLYKCIQNEYGGDVVVQAVPGITFGAPTARPSVALTSGHLSCTDTFAWSREYPFMTGTTLTL